MSAPCMLVYRAHAAAFCTRARGLIALSVREGARVHVVDLTHGESGESEDYWKETPGAQRLTELARLLKQHRPKTVVTHWNQEPHNPDHEVTARAGEMFAFEPTVSRNDDTGFRPANYVAIDGVFEQKLKAIARLRSQRKPAKMYTQWAEYRGAQARHWTVEPARYAEAYYRHSAEVSRGLIHGAAAAARISGESHE